MSGKPRILILHALTINSLSNVVIRDVELASSLRRFGDVIFVNVLGLRHDQIQGYFDLTVITDSVMMRRSGSAWRYLSRQLRILCGRSRNTVVIVQDDYELPDRIVSLARSTNADIYSSLKAQLDQYQCSDLKVHHWPLTLVDPNLRTGLENFRVPWDERTFDIVSRVNRTPIRFGMEGRRKAVFAQNIAHAARQHSLAIDISDKPEDRILGDNWWQFLANSRFTVCRQGGASRVMTQPWRIVFAEAVEKALKDNVIESQLNILDWISSETKSLIALSPRFVEAAGLGVVQIVEETCVAHEMTPWEHYLPVASDGSNIDTVLRFVRSRQATAIADQCFDLFFESGRFSHDDWYEKMAQNAGLQSTAGGVVSVPELELELHHALFERISRRTIGSQEVSARELHNIFRKYDCPPSALIFPWVSVDVSRLSEKKK